MGKAADYVSSLNERISNAIKRIEPYKAFVHAPKVEDGKVQIITVGADTADAEPYARLLGPAVYEGEQVAVINLGGKPFVLGKIQDVLREFIVFDGGVRVEDDMMVWGNSVVGMNLDVLGKVTAKSFNSPVVHVTTDTSATTASTTTLNTWYEHGRVTYTLPTGSWTVYMSTTAGITHSANGGIWFSPVINGVGGQLTYGAATPGGSHFTAVQVAYALSGTVTMSCNFQNKATGTATALYSTFTMIAVRTA